MSLRGSVFFFFLTLNVCIFLHCKVQIPLKQDPGYLLTKTSRNMWNYLALLVAYLANLLWQMLDRIHRWVSNRHDVCCLLYQSHAFRWHENCSGCQSTWDINWFHPLLICLFLQELWCHVDANIRNFLAALRKLTRHLSSEFRLLLVVKWVYYSALMIEIQTESFSLLDFLRLVWNRSHELQRYYLRCQAPWSQRCEHICNARYRVRIPRNTAWSLFLV